MEDIGKLPEEVVMAKALVVDYSLCTNCRLCAMVCSVKKEGVSDLTRSRIKIFTHEMQGIYLPAFCRHCENPPCASVCPVEAITRDKVSGVVSLNEEECIGCEECISACPYGGATWHVPLKKVLRCDLCDGNPECVKFCFSQALSFRECDPEYLRQARIESAQLLKKMIETVGA